MSRCSRPKAQVEGSDSGPGSELPELKTGCRGADSRVALLEAALQCFATHGFDGTSIRDIARKAQRNSSLIGHYFQNKEGLYIEVFRHLFRVRKCSFGGDPSAPYRSPRDRSEAVALLRDLLRIQFSDFSPYPENPQRESALDLGRRLFLHEMREPRPEVVALLRERLGPWIHKFGECLIVLKPELSKTQRSFLGISIMGELMSHRMMQSLRLDEWGLEGLPAAQAVELLVDFNLRALGVSCDPLGDG